MFGHLYLITFYAKYCEESIDIKKIRRFIQKKETNLIKFHMVPISEIIQTNISIFPRSHSNQITFI